MSLLDYVLYLVNKERLSEAVNRMRTDNAMAI
jgi:hypothetical protein